MKQWAMQWVPDTCYCIIQYDIPNSNDGEFIKKCRIHQSSRNVNDVWDHNKLNKSKQFEGIDKATRPTEADQLRRRNLKESTRP